jgi:hypothetical protein
MELTILNRDGDGRIDLLCELSERALNSEHVIVRNGNFNALGQCDR